MMLEQAEVPRGMCGHMAAPNKPMKLTVAFGARSLLMMCYAPGDYSKSIKTIRSDKSILWRQVG
jgi:phosphoenolpyruvate-protein kinase (PTS system EI component)